MSLRNEMSMVAMLGLMMNLSLLVLTKDEQLMITMMMKVMMRSMRTMVLVKSMMPILVVLISTLIVTLITMEPKVRRKMKMVSSWFA